MQRFSLLFLLLCIGCQDRLSVQNEYIGLETLASTHIRTPDLRKDSPDVGQRLIIYWSFRKEDFKNHAMELRLQVITRHREKDVLRVPLEHSSGDLIYDILNEDYHRTGGILTYFIEILQDGVAIEEWRHQMWVELIHFDKSLRKLSRRDSPQQVEQRPIQEES